MIVPFLPLQQKKQTSVIVAEGTLWPCCLWVNSITGHTGVLIAQLDWSQCRSYVSRMSLSRKASLDRGISVFIMAG